MNSNNDIVIKVKNLSKVYQKRSKEGAHDDFYALKNVSFEVRKGEVLGIIGKNGSGKSTLLKILSGVTKPTDGSVEINGTVVSILDVGTGMHPDLSGRENIYLRGELLGMTKYEIDKVFDDIVAFSEISEFIETPVKHYSSGMFLRLAFSIIIHLKCDVLLLDEVMSVGDESFRRKCEFFLKSDQTPKTVVIVGHNIRDIGSVSQRIATFSNGIVETTKNTRKAIEEYMTASIHQNYAFPIEEEKFHIKNIQTLNSIEEKQQSFRENENIVISICFKCMVKNIHLGFIISDSLNNQLMGGGTYFKLKKLKEGCYQLKCSLDNELFNSGTYNISVVIYHEFNILRRYENLWFFLIKKEEELFGKINLTLPIQVHSKQIILNNV